jgi:hypothetical protein
MNNNSSENSPRTSRFYNVLSAFLAFFLWGGWAYFVNGSTDITRCLISGLTQGTASFIITLVMVHWSLGFSIIYWATFYNYR